MHLGLHFLKLDFLFLYFLLHLEQRKYLANILLLDHHNNLHLSICHRGYLFYHILLKVELVSQDFQLNIFLLFLCCIVEGLEHLLHLLVCLVVLSCIKKDCLLCSFFLRLCLFDLLVLLRICPLLNLVSKMLLHFQIRILLFRLCLYIILGILILL